MAPEMQEGAPFAAELQRLLGDKVAECVHCGFCLSSCPTYSELGTEMDSPRGRIHLIHAMAEGRIGPAENVTHHLDLCLDCRACETACPSGVRYGAIIEGARTIMEPYRPRPLWQRIAREAAFRHILPRRRVLALIVRLLRAWQDSPLSRFVSRLLPPKMREMEALAPRVTGRPFSAHSPQVIPAVEPKRGCVAFFVGCIMDQAMGPIHRATARVLAKNGYDVVIPPAQTCCGALHVHNGAGEIARGLARRNIVAFEKAGVDRIIINSAGCGAAIREYEELLHDDAVFLPRAKKMAAATVDVSTFLGSIELRPPQGAVPKRVCYDEPCHLLHAQGISTQPKAILKAIPGLQVVPLMEADWCCGAAGIYNITQPEMSRRLLDRKMDFVAASKADLLITANPGCLIQLEAGVRRRGLPLQVVHLIELLDQAYAPTKEGDRSGVR